MPNTSSDRAHLASDSGHGGQVAAYTSGITSSPMYLILDLAVTAGQSVPNTMKVDYVRV